MAQCKFYKQLQYYSDDDGVTWFQTGLSKQGDLIEARSEDCEEPFDGRYIFKYTSSHLIRSGSCDSSSAITTTDTQEQHQASHSSITEAIIGDCVTTIGDSAFDGCTGLTNITIGSGLTSIGRYVFSNCFSLSSITIPSSVTSIGNGVFGSCRNLQSITIEAVTPPSLGGDAFNGNDCPIYVPCGSVNTYKDSWKLYAPRIQGIPPCRPSIDGKYLFEYDMYKTRSGSCDSSSAITTADTYDYDYRTSAMTQAVIGDCVTSIDDGAFWGCQNLRVVTISDSVTTIGDNAFGSGTSLISVAIGDGVTSIGSRAFRGCTKLKSIDIPSGVTSIGELCFSGCTKLANVTVEASVPPTLGTSAFFYVPINAIYVPAASVNTYKAASGWSNFEDKIQPIPNS